MNGSSGNSIFLPAFGGVSVMDCDCSNSCVVYLLVVIPSSLVAYDGHRFICLFSICGSSLLMCL